MKAKSWGLVAVVSGLVIAFAFIGDVAVGCLDGANEAFYAACAQIAPIFGLAVFVEIAVVMAPAVSNDAGGVAKATVRSLVRLNVAMLVISETGALFAVASGSDSGFLTLCCVLPWAVQVVLFVDALYYRVGLNTLGTYGQG